MMEIARELFLLASGFGVLFGVLALVDLLISRIVFAMLKRTGNP